MRPRSNRHDSICTHLGLHRLEACSSVLLKVLFGELCLTKYAFNSVIPSEPVSGVPQELIPAPILPQLKGTLSSYISRRHLLCQALSLFRCYLSPNSTAIPANFLLFFCASEPLCANCLHQRYTAPRCRSSVAISK